MLQALARQRATGVLTVQGQEGWKVLEIKAGSVALVSGVSGKRLRIGDILQARGKISHEVLAKALATQRTTGAPLGDILIERGFVSRRDLEEIVHFQLEEEIYDLFTWRGAECTFEPGATIGDQLEGYPDVTNLEADPQRIFVEAAHRIPVWQQIERVVYSPHMIFGLTERGAAMLETATRGGRRLLELVQQAYCVNTIVLKAMVGRFAIWKALSDLVDAQAVAAIPDAELPELASRWESEGKLEQASGAYLRLAETTTDARRIDDLRHRAEALQGQLRAAEDQALYRAEQAGETSEASSRYRMTVILLAVLAAAVMALVLAPALKITGRASGEDMDAFKRAGRKTQKLREEGNLDDAIELWDEFLAKYPEGTVADLARDARQLFLEDYEDLVQHEITRALKLVEEDKFNEALEHYSYIREKFSRTGKKVRLSDLTRTAEKKRDAYTKMLDYEDLVVKFERGRDMLKQKRYSEAKGALQTVIKAESAGPELRQQAREEMKVIEQVEAKAEKLVMAARAKEEQGQLDDAIDIYSEVCEVWFSSRWGREAARKKTVLGINRTRAERLCREGIRFSDKGDSVGAQGKLREAAGYKGYKAAEVAARKLEDIASERERVAELLKREKRLREDGKLDEAFDVMVEIADRFPVSASRLNLNLEISIETVPPNARVFLSGQELGRSPITTSIGPRQSGVLLLKKPGFKPLREKFERVRKRVMQFRLQKEIAFRRSVGQAMFSAAVIGKPEDERARPLLFVQAGPCLASFAPGTGNELWRVEPGAAPFKRARPAVLGETVFIASGDRLRGYSLTGSPRLDVSVGASAATSPAPVRLRLLANRIFVVLACEDGTAVSFDVRDRERRWTTPVNPPVSFDLAVSEKAAFVPSGGGTIVALGILDGEPLWTAPVPGEAGGDLAIDLEGKLVGVVTGLGEAYVLSAADGQVRMRVPLDRAHGGAMALTGETAFVGTDDGRLRAVDVETATVKWSVAVKGAVRDAPTLHGSNVYVGTGDGHIVCVDAQSGRVEWSFDAEAPIAGSGTVFGDTIIFGTHDGELIGIKVKGAVR